MISTNLCIQAVVEAPWYEGEPLWPWSVADYKQFSHIRLYGEITDLEIGLIFAQLVDYNNLENQDNVNEVIHRLIESKSLILPGGLQVKSTTGEVISPSCCCGLESWREWLNFLTTRESPWLGHDPSPWLEMVDGVVHVWSDGGIDLAPSAFHIDFEQFFFEAELSKVQQELSAFLVTVEAWASKVGFCEPSKLSRKFDECFAISSQ